MAETLSQPTLDACREITWVSRSPTGRFQTEWEPQRLGPSMSCERQRCLGPEADWKRSALVNAGCPGHLARCPGPEQANALAPPSPHHRQPGVARTGDETQPGATSEWSSRGYVGSALDLCVCRGRICLKHLPSEGKNLLWGEGKPTHEGNGASAAWSSGFLRQQLGVRCYAQQGGDGHGVERKLHLSHGASSSISSPMPYQRDNCQHNLRKDVAGNHLRSSHPTKGIGHMWFALRHSHIKARLGEHNR